MLNLEFIRIRHARSRNCFGVRAGPPRLADLVPGVIGVLHLGPDKVVSSVRHGAVGGRIDAGRHGAAHQLAPDSSLILAGFHTLVPGGGVKALPYFQVFILNGPWLTAPAGAISLALL